MTTNLLGKEQYRTNTQDLGWEEERAEFEDHRENIGDMQRMLSAIAGMFFLASGLSRRNWSGAALVTIGGGLLYRATSGYCPAFGAMGIDMSGNNRSSRPSDTSRLGRRKVHTDRATKIQRAIEINRPPTEMYRFWRSLDNLPRIMNHLDSVQVINDRLSHWVVKAMPGVPKVEWDAEIINDVENQRIGWRSLQGADVDNAGSVEFKPTGDGQRTWLTVRLQYESSGGKLGAAVAQWFGEDPNTKIAKDLRRFKEEMETGVFSRADAR
ncbi:MAG TPA: SRPBCC family protein [Nitrospira sp.]|nr:SRPBCC family protein [Nitrospira sp.]